MTRPQQPELDRSRRDAADQDSAKAKASTYPEQGNPHGTDKPTRRRRGRRGRGGKGGGRGGGVPPEQQSPYPG